mgnify:CR=1 FL=1
MKVQYNDPLTGSAPNYQRVAALPSRRGLVLPAGSVARIPIDVRRPDAHTIIAALQLVVDQWGRDPRVRQATTRLLTSRVNNDRGNIDVVFRWVVNHMTYLADPDGGELVQTPIILLDQVTRKGRAYGDCDDHVVLLGAMLVSIGVPARVVGVKLGASPIFNHVVVEVPSNGGWRVLDPCAKQTAAPNYRERLVVG